jgi:hypothetical protein
MWRFAHAIEGLGDACRALSVPIVSGNVSLYNETEGKPILPTPSGGHRRSARLARRSWGSAFKVAGDVIVHLGVPERRQPRRLASCACSSRAPSAATPQRIDLDARGAPPEGDARDGARARGAVGARRVRRRLRGVRGRERDRRRPRRARAHPGPRGRRPERAPRGALFRRRAEPHRALDEQGRRERGPQDRRRARRALRGDRRGRRHDARDRRAPSRSK